ncbi:MAG: ornithine carbamoyltransferase [Alphaproteobacteria bacterium]|nr:ornithine carbamoyltransferase [Alphaproteobacteria bacterium]|tara:strand:+ start:140 stop:1036 length:897 start_codon:yes stop_codon:yes gene_type:complete
MKKIRHFLNLDELSKKDIHEIVSKSHILKKNYGKTSLKRKKILAMIFEKPSTRTRVSFEVGMKKINGEVVILDQNDTQLARGESLSDTIKVLSRYVDIIMYRGSDEKKLYEISKSSNVPIINGLTNQSHPCQIIADLMTLEENFKNINKINLCWLGDGNNVCNSWIHASKHYDFNLNISSPKGFFPKKKVIDKVKKNTIKLYEDPEEAIKGADVLITDTWESMGMKKKKATLKKFEEFQINTSLLKKTNKETFVLHCLPAHRGNEITNNVIDGEHSLVWDEAQNRLYAHQSILFWCLK